MDRREFQNIRQEFQKTQKQMSELLGTSLKAVQSFEQGWRKVPLHIERQILFLRAMKSKKNSGVKTCWEIMKCSTQARESCPAWEFDLGHLCWFINGTICQGKPQDNWSMKMKLCRRCKVFAQAQRS